MLPTEGIFVPCHVIVRMGAPHKLTYSGQCNTFVDGTDW